MTLAYALLIPANLVLSLAWVVALIARTIAVPGSHRRYVLASIEFGSRWGFYVVNPLYLCVGHVIGEISRGGLVYNAGLLMMIIALTDHGDEDNWFRRQGRRLRAWLTALAPGRLAGAHGTA